MDIRVTPSNSYTISELVGVKKDGYGCSKCTQSFSRKGNAERHNERMHDALDTIEDLHIKPMSNVEVNTKGFFLKNKFKKLQSASAKGKSCDADYLFYEYT